MSALWTVLADLMVALHFGFLAYLLAGGFLAWRWPRTIVLHLLTAVWAALIVTVRLECPLTYFQNFFRHRNGLPSVEGGFIQTYAKGTLYPSNLERLSQIVVGVVVIVSWAGYVRLIRQRRRPDASPVRTAEVRP